ncbi:hypothetical protein L3Q82_002702 [Scortum barcoo]|uniref:Uncharacterized protein n=1 Tax=Scortum barcoo TaxID=214431 RepID=A0ACB8VW72_9TELE|nr:hypothetical protein L3Q82_002702 [Scortum barcoo]
MQVLVRRCADGAELRGRIVETEAYLGGEDKASHSAGGKHTKRNTAMFMKPGTIYVYPIYGIYLCMNVSSEGEGAAVLLRSLEPLQGQPVMRQLRTARRKEGARELKDKELCNGPSKLCQALDIPRCFDRRDLASDPEVLVIATATLRKFNLVSLRLPEFGHRLCLLANSPNLLLVDMPHYDLGTPFWIVS